MPLRNRSLAAILFTDIVGSTAMMQKNERSAIFVNKRYSTVLKESVLSRSGEILNDFGDGSLCTFHSATEAMACAIEMQQKFQLEPIVPLRIGLHIGEIFFEEGKVFGDGVNVASRIQSLGVANSILFSSVVKNEIKNHQEFTFVSIGKFHFKNVDEPMEIFALSNEGLSIPKKEELTGKLKEIKIKSHSKKIAITAAVFLFLITAFFFYKYFFSQQSFTKKEKSIAILPFANMSKDKDNEYFSDGMTDEIITQVSKIPLLKVISRTSVMQYKNPTKSLKQIAEELSVSFILEGGIQKAGDTVRINAQLIDASSGYHIWADNYDKNIKELFAIQSEVAEKIANALETKLTPQEKRNLSTHYTDNVEAYKFYRKGRWFWGKRTKSSFDSAEIYYNKAIELDPDYAIAYSGLADIYIYPNNGLTQREAIPIARKYATSALLKDSTLSEALTTLGFIQSAFDYEWAQAKSTLEKAIALNPNYPTAHLFYGNLLQYTGESTERGIDEIKKALSLDPLSINLNYVLGRNYYAAHKFDSAYDQLRKTLTLDSGFNLAKGNLVYILLARKQYSEAFEVIKHIDKTGTSKTAYYQGPLLCYAYAVTGDKTRAKMELEKTLAEYPDQSPYHLAGTYLLLNDYNEVFNKLEKAYDLRELFVYFLKVDPTFETIRNEPRFKSLMKKINLK